MKPRYLKPFWSYYGGKWMRATAYPAPQHEVIIEPFAGAAGYSLRHYSRRVILIDKYPVVARIWRFLIDAHPDDIRNIPLVDAVDDLPRTTPQPARDLVGFLLNMGTTRPARTLSAGLRKHRERQCPGNGWSLQRRERIASQVPLIRHWEIIEGSYLEAPPITATWFIDPPYSGPCGRYYVENKIDYPALGAWCRARKGQAIVCESDGADWLPFVPIPAATYHSSLNSRATANEVWWTNGYEMLL